ncbi:MAG: hypothetical protein ABL996_00640 [Micropepsaceae bacterium]
MRQLLSVLFLACVTPALAEPIAADSPRWKIEHGESSIVSLKGQRALFLNGAIATLADANFDTGVIEFDMLLPSAAQSFPGIYFRGQDDDNHEHFYLRPHQNGRPDANQYTPVINGVTGWQIYSQYNGRMTYRLKEWFHVRLEVAEDSAQIYVDAPDQPALAVHDLKRERKAGYIALKGSLGGAYYANINITRAQPEAAPPEPAKELPAGLVRAWSVSPAMAEAEALAAAGGNRLNALSWTTLPVETNGIANLARVAIRTDERPTTLTHLSLRASRARSVAMRFGFSDRVHVYLNGTLLFAGDDTQNSRDYRFLGTVGLYDTLFLPLRRGDNDIVFAISEGGGGNAVGGGGWAAIAAFPDMTGLTLLPR